MSTVLDSRVIRIIRWLLAQNEPMPTAALAADLGLSQRVVRYRLGAAEAYLKSQGAALSRRRVSHPIRKQRIKPPRPNGLPCRRVCLER